jgi:N-acetylglucosaminyldiphosphoundecaprenol N-acetyl-beta-D-mannosaminyltransferase
MCQHDLVAVNSVARQRVLGLNFISANSEEDVAEMLLSGGDPDRSADLPVVLTPNVDIIVRMARGGASAEAAALRAQYVLPDGAPVVWASRLLGCPLPARLAGSTLFSIMWPRLSGHRRVVVVASRQETVDRLGGPTDTSRFLVAPQLSDHRSADLDAFVASILETCRGFNPEFVFIGLPYPKQQTVAHRVLDDWTADMGQRPITLMMGGSAEMYVGLQTRAPEWMQRFGLEWFFRFLQEPRRLFKRYFVDDTLFALIVWRAWRSVRSSKSQI